MIFDLRRRDGDTLEAAARHYEQHGFVRLDGLEETVTARFRPILAEALDLDDASLTGFLTETRPATLLPPDVRRRLARVPTSPGLAQGLLATLGEPLLNRLIGPLVHVSSTFHVQVKGGTTEAADHGGYSPGGEHMEVHQPYLLHQDFTGASFPTSPSGVTLWVPLNSCRDWTLRLYPASHRQGLLCQRWIRLDDPRLAPLGEPLDVPARVGTAVMFNALVLHGTSNEGPGRRLSCDIRFFPLCGFLPSTPYVLGADPDATLRARVAAGTDGPVLRAPLLEDLTYLGAETRQPVVPPLSVLNWVNYLAGVMRGEAEAALPHLERFTNQALGTDAPSVYIAKFHGHPLQEPTLRAARARLGVGSVSREGPGATDAPRS